MIESPEVIVFGGAACVCSQEIMRRLIDRKAKAAYIDIQDFHAEGVLVNWISNSDDDLIEITYLRDGRTISTKELKSAYFREVAPGISLQKLAGGGRWLLEAADAEAYHWEQIQRFSGALLEYLSTRCFCLFPRAPSAHAEHKLMQLSLAQQCGFRVPETYVGFNLDEMRSFLRRRGRAVVKSFRPHHASGGGRMFRSIVSVIALEDLDTLKGSRVPVILQEAVTPKRDVRVGVVGKKVMSVSMTTTGEREDELVTDVRHYAVLGQYGSSRSVSYERFELPGKMQDRVLRFVKALGLQYSMMDLGVTPDGEYFFFENNPKGMPGEVGRGGHDVAGAIADLLLNPEENKL
jgi:glutathione synthase/RimK-type ligase-like ATP-grasp enzyme